MRRAKKYLSLMPRCQTM